MYFKLFFKMEPHEDHNLKYLVIDISEKQKWLANLITKGGNSGDLNSKSNALPLSN